MSTTVALARGAVLLMSTANAVNFSGFAMLDWADGMAVEKMRAAAETAATKAERIEPPVTVKALAFPGPFRGGGGAVASAFRRKKIPRLQAEEPVPAAGHASLGTDGSAYNRAH